MAAAFAGIYLCAISGMVLGGLLPSQTMVDPATWVLFGAQVFALALWLRFYQRWSLKEFLAGLVPVEIATLLYILLVGGYWEWLYPELSLAKALDSKGIRLFCYTNFFLGLPWIAGFVVASLRKSWINRRAKS